MTDEPHPRRKDADPSLDPGAGPAEGGTPAEPGAGGDAGVHDPATDASAGAGAGAGMRRGPLVAVAVAVVVVLIGVIVLSARKSDTVDAAAITTTTTRFATTAGSSPGTDATTEETFPEDGVTIATVPGIPLPPPRQPDPLPGPPFTTVTPVNQGQLAVYNTPFPGGGVRTLLPNPRLIGNNPSAAVPLTLLVKQWAGDFYEVYLPIRPNGSTGFVKSTDVTRSVHDYHLEVRLAQFNIKAFKGNQVILDAPIGIATDNTPTPGGTYFTTELIKPTNSAYGPFAYGLSGYSEVLQTFNGGPGQIGIHGTSNERGIPGKVSHGCIRLRNRDITTLANVLPLAVPVQIYP